jgi:hypothetical protein
MALEAFGNNISTLVATNPTGADAKSTADDHIRGVKSVLLAQFPALTAPVTATHTELNRVAGVTSAIQTQIDSKAALASPTFTGTPAAPTATLGTNSTQLASTAFVASAIANVNAQTATVVAVVSGTSQAAVAGSHYVLTNVAATTVTLPATPSSGDTVWVTWANTLTTNVIARNGQTIMGLAEDMTLDATTNGTVQLRFVNSSWRIV